MAEAQLHFAKFEDDNKPILSLDVALKDIVNGEDDTFRTENLSANDFERRNVIERTSSDVHTRVELLDVTHGHLQLGDDSDEATLMVFRFRFDPQKNSRRVLRATVSIEFFASDQDEDPPVVEAIAPFGRFTVMPTIDHVSTTRAGELNLGISGASIVTGNAAAKLERTRTRDINDATTIIGSMQLGTGRNKGDYTVVTWNLLENKHRNSGVPDSLKAAILLRRADSEPFIAKVSLDADFDFVTGFKSKFSKVPLDDPVLFNPSFTGKRRKKEHDYGNENMGDIKLDKLFEVRMAGSLMAPSI